MASFTPVPPGARRPSKSAHQAPLLEGPRWYRSRIRVLGPLVGLVVPGIVGVIAVVALRVFEGPMSGATGLVGGVFAAPALLAVGAPFGENDLYPIAVLASVVLWLVVGFVAARRATRNPMATWSDFWRHFAWLCAGVWAGALIALGVAALVIGESLY